MINVSTKNVRNISNNQKSVDLTYANHNNISVLKDDTALNLSINGNKYGYLNKKNNFSLNILNKPSQSIIKSLSPFNPNLKYPHLNYLNNNNTNNNSSHSHRYTLDYNKNISTINSPQSPQKSTLRKAGMDIMNANRVMMNFNKKNIFGSGYLSKHLKIAENKKIPIKQNNIVIKEIEMENEKLSKNNNYINPVVNSVNSVNSVNNSVNNSINNSINLDNSVNKEINNISISNLIENQIEITHNETNIKNTSFQTTIKNQTNTTKFNNNSIILPRKKQIINDNLKLNLLDKVSNDDIDNSVNFLREINTEDTSFSNNLRLFQAYMEIEFSVDSFGSGSPSGYFFSAGDKKPSLIFSLKKYFAILKEEYEKNYFQTNEFFLFDSLNKFYLKTLKIQMILLTAIFICNTHAILDLSIKSQIKKLIVSLTSPFVNFFEFFIYNQVLLNYNDILSKDLRPEFSEKYTKIYKNYKMQKLSKLSDYILILNKNLDNVSINIKQFSNVIFKFSQLKPCYNVVFDLLKDIDQLTIGQLTYTILKNILYCHLESSFIPRNKKKSGIKDNMDYAIPFLPEKTTDSKYEYTLVLDLDETLVHFFYTQLSGGMFFVRPGALEFLKELCEIYEIVIFTAATKDYADDILDKLDPEGTIFKYRLYRNHTSTLGLHVIKDLSKLGRDLSRVIIIDNIPENFKLQPNNGLMIKTWTDNINDTQLKDILGILKNLNLLKIPDVRVIIKKIKDDMLNLKSYSNIEVATYV